MNNFEDIHFEDIPLVNIDNHTVANADDIQVEHDSIVIEQRADVPTHPDQEIFREDEEPQPQPQPPLLEPPVSEATDEERAPEHYSEPSDTPQQLETEGQAPDITALLNPPENRYNLRSSSRGTRTEWNKQSQQPINSDNIKFGFHISVRKALKDPRLKIPAQESIKIELTNMLKKQVFKGLLAGEEAAMQPPIPSHMFLKEKFTPNGDFDKLRARLVANGQYQDRYTTYENISSPTASVPVILMIAAIAAKEGRDVKTADVPVAYLNAPNSHLKITMRLDPFIARILCEVDPSFKRYLRADGTIVVLLKKALYGCIESAKLWYDFLTDTLAKEGFQVNPLEPCVMNKTVQGKQCTVVIYIDDLKFTSQDESITISAIAALEKRFDCKLSVTSGKQHDYLGMHWDYSVDGEVKITMKGFTDDILSDCTINGIASSPAANHLFQVREDSVKLSQSSKEQFHTLVAKLLYLAKRVRPDLLLAISFLTTRVLNPDTDDQLKLDRVMRYLSSTSELGIVLKATPATQVQAYIDASYGVHSDYRSHTGMYITLGYGPIDVKSTKQKLNTKSSTESELVALSDMSSRVIWCRNFLTAQGETDHTALVYQDNLSTKALAERGAAASDRTRHVSLRYFWITDRMKSGDIEVIYKPTNDMVADILTKPLQGEQFKRLRDLLLNWSY
jgi:hypothetical protein